MTGNDSFLSWLALQARRDDAVGDCARDMLDDPEWPATATTLDSAEEYLKSVLASPMAINALHIAWDEWQRRR